MANILLVTQHFPPDIGAASNRMAGLVKTFRQSGHTVQVITAEPNALLNPRGGRPDQPGASASIGPNADNAAVKVARVPLPVGRRGMAGRLQRDGQFVLRAGSRLRSTDNIDVVVCSIGPPFVGLVGILARWFTRAPLIVDVRDLSYLQLRGVGGGALPVGAMRLLERTSVRAAQFVVTCSQRLSQLVTENFGLAPERVFTVTNGADLPKQPAADPGEPATSGVTVLPPLNEAVERHRLVFGYFGTVGLSQDIGEAAAALQGKPDVGLVVVGDGAAMNELRSIAPEMPNLYLVPTVSPRVVTHLYHEVDFALVKLNTSPAFAYAIPSKLFEIMASGGVPLFWGPEGEAADIAGRVHPLLVCHSREDFIERLPELATMDRAELAARARAVSADYDRQRLNEQFLHVVNLALDETNPS